MLNLILFVCFFANVYTQTTTPPFQGNTDWCVPAPVSTGPGFPTLPNQFQTVVEANYRTAKENYTSEFEEYYDFVGNRGTLIQYSLFTEIRQYFLYDTNEMITTFSQACYVNPLDTAAIGTPFGYDSGNGNSTGHIFSPINALKLEYTQEFQGEDVVRGISVKVWKSCAFIPELNSTVRIYWSFSNNETWNSTIHFGDLSLSVPVEMRLEGLASNGETWEQRYEYIKFRPTLIESSEIFETPVGVFCPGRKPTKPLPKIPPHFSYRVEATSVDLTFTTNQAEWYDDENKLVRLDRQPILQSEIDLLGTSTVSEIHDFKRGIKFIIDKKSERCVNYTVLDPQSIDFDYDNGTKFVRLRTALELFNFDKNASVQYQYHGTRKVRNIDCDVWIAIRDNWPPQPNVNRTSTWEWYFMSSNWIDYNNGQAEFNIPVKLIITNYNFVTDTTYFTTTTIYNYFDYTQEKPDIFAYDLQYCFEEVDVKHLLFRLDGSYSKVAKNRKDVKYAVLTSIAKLGYLLPTRITDIDLDDRTNDETVVVFKLLGKLPIKGDVENPVEEISLSDAYSLLEKAINGGNFEVSFNGTVLKAIPKSLKEFEKQTYDEPAKKSSNTSVFIIVGSAIGGIVVGAILVVLITVLLRKKAKGEPVLRMSGLMNPNFRE